MRLIFIPGFGETQRIFDQIAPHLPGEKLFINNLDLLGTTHFSAITAIQYAQMLIKQHQITREDCLIGHSMGGWIAYAAKHLTGCRVVQIASWIDPKKVILPLKKPEYIYWLVRNGWLFNRFNKQLILRLRYRNKPSAQIFGEVFQNLINSSPEYLVNQLEIILNPLESTIDTQPEMSIHSKKDLIVGFPDHPVITVSGDHFNLITYPQEVITAINAFLKPTPNNLYGK
ncbi:alpha/beta fold hydrolase [Spirosoma flavum]|uniref:Alpha/beta fold hydrolase n=1 Tax=Spirosoma flavum TaxID=2048557 RepID=A0ABW6AQA1_9BACT